MTIIAKPQSFEPGPSAFPYGRLQRFSVAQYHRMIASGALTEDDPVELLEGWLVAKMPRDPHHDGCLLKLQNRLLRMLSVDWLLRVQSAVTTKDSEPEPDLAIVSGPEEKYFDRHPCRLDMGLIIEIANTTLEDDRVIKGRIYARERFPVYWIVNLQARQVEVYSDPRGGKSAGYRGFDIFSESERLAVVVAGKHLGDVTVNDILPPLGK